jgi:hypothetical protein
MNNKITLSALLLAVATTVGFMLPGTAAASDKHAAKREALWLWPLLSSLA